MRCLCRSPCPCSYHDSDISLIYLMSPPLPQLINYLPVVGISFLTIVRFPSSRCLRPSKHGKISLFHCGARCLCPFQRGKISLQWMASHPSHHGKISLYWKNKHCRTISIYRYEKSWHHSPKEPTH